MKRTFTTAIIVALTATIGSLDAAAMTGKSQGQANHQTLSFGPGKKDTKPVVVGTDVTPPTVDRTAVVTQDTATASQPAKDDYRKSFNDGPTSEQPAVVGDAILTLMFGGPARERAGSEKPRRQPPTLKKID